MKRYTRVKNYTTKQLIDHVKSLDSYRGIPEGYWLLGVQSNEDLYNHFDDKFYLFRGSRFVTVATGTTNAGTTGLMNYKKYNKNGVLVVKTDEWYHGLWKYGLHRGKMPALRQVRPITYFRDWNKNTRIEEQGKLRTGIRGINFHTVLYQRNLSFVRRLIGGWSVGCQVVNDVGRYYMMLDKMKNQESVTYCLIKEF